MTRRRRQRGFTIIELMISLLVSSLLTILILSIFTRMSFAYREQQQVVQVQQVLSAARAALDKDAKLAGLYMAQGFTLAADWDAGQRVRRSPVRIFNSNTGPDEIAFYYADAATLAVVTDTVTPTRTTVSIDENPGLAVGDRIVMSTPRLVSSAIDATNDGKIMTYDACVLDITGIAGTTVSFAASAGGNDHCGLPVPSNPYPGPQGGTIIAKLVAHHWRIDRSSAARIELGALQLDPTGALGGIVDASFTDQAYGVVDLQLAAQFYDAGNRTWEPDEDQETKTAPILATAAFDPLLLLSVSVLARTTQRMEGVTTAATPALGDRPSESLPSANDGALLGQRVYRYLTFQADFRNTGVGQ